MMDPILESLIMNQLRENKCGQTVDELQQHLKESQGRILTVLHALSREGHVELQRGLWFMVREESK
jgi:CTP-dependent riboflavin kinase